MSLRLVRRKKSPNWVIRGTVRGIRVEESTGISDRRIAEEIRAKRESEILEQTIYGRRATATFAEAALSYLEAGGNRRFLELIIKHFGVTPLAKIDQDAIDRGARKVYPGVADTTRDRQFYTPTSTVLKHAAKRGWCSPIILLSACRGEKCALTTKRLRSRRNFGLACEWPKSECTQMNISRGLLRGWIFLSATWLVALIAIA
jgi:hypothetical protein